MLAREYASEKKMPFSPIIVDHHMLPGLRKDTMKMSKSDPSGSIFMEDTAEVVQEKIKGAYCPEDDPENNPILSYFNFIVFGSGKFDKIKVTKTDGSVFEFVKY